MIYILVVSDTSWQTAHAPGPSRESLWRKHRTLRVSGSCASSHRSGLSWAPIAIREVLAEGTQRESGHWSEGVGCLGPLPLTECSRTHPVLSASRPVRASQQGQSSRPCRSRAGRSVRGTGAASQAAQGILSSDPDTGLIRASGAPYVPDNGTYFLDSPQCREVFFPIELKSCLPTLSLCCGECAHAACSADPQVPGALPLLSRLKIPTSFH